MTKTLTLTKSKVLFREKSTLYIQSIYCVLQHSISSLRHSEQMSFITVIKDVAGLSDGPQEDRVTLCRMRQVLKWTDFEVLCRAKLQSEIQSVKLSK